MNELFSYLFINRSPKISLLSNDDQISLTMNVYTTVAAITDDSIGKEINKYFNRLIPNNGEDLLQINIRQAKMYSEKYKPQKENVSKVVNKVLMNEYNSSFSFDKVNTEDLALILVRVYTLLSSRSTLKKYSIKTFMDIIKKAEDIKAKKINVTQLFVNKEEVKKDSFVSGSSPKKSTFCSSTSKGNASLLEDNLMTQLSMYQYPKPNKEISSINFELPIEMIILINKFSSIKKISLLLDDLSEKKKIEYLIILLNLQWLFPSLIDVDFDLSNEDLQTDIDTIMKKKIEKRKKNDFTKKTTMYDISNRKRQEWNPIVETSEFAPFDIERISMRKGDDLISRQSFTTTASPPIDCRRGSRRDNGDSLSGYILSNTNPFEMIIIISYFISQLQKLNYLSLTFQDSFSLEIETAMKKFEVSLVNFHFLNFLSIFSKLYELNIQFNSLDFKSFEKLIAIVNQNTSLDKLRLSFFTPEGNYSPSGLYKLYHGSCSLKLTSRTTTKKSKNESNFENNEMDHLIVSNLINAFEENMRKLFFIIQNKSKMHEIVILFDLPCIIANNDAYNLILIKFILNMLILLSFEKHEYRIIKLIAPYLKLDNRKDIFIDECIEEISLKDNKSIQHFDFQFQIYQLDHIANLISYNYLSLFLGEIDAVTFCRFVEYYSNKDFLSKSKLQNIKIIFNTTIVNFEDVSENIYTFLSSKPKNLKEITLISNMKIHSQEEIEKIVNYVIYKSKTQINFEVSGDNNEDIDQEMYKVYQQSQGERNLFYAAIKSRKYKNLLQSKKFKETLNSFYKLPNHRIIKGKSI